jgi:hypothetical protein
MYYLYIPETKEIIGDHMYIDDLNEIMCALSEFSDYLYNKNKK